MQKVNTLGTHYSLSMSMLSRCKTFYLKKVGLWHQSSDMESPCLERGWKRGVEMDYQGLQYIRGKKGVKEGVFNVNSQKLSIASQKIVHKFFHSETWTWESCATIFWGDVGQMPNFRFSQKIKLFDALNVVST